MSEVGTVATKEEVFSTTFTESLQPLPGLYSLYPVSTALTSFPKVKITTTFTQSLQPLPSLYSLDQLRQRLSSLSSHYSLDYFPKVKVTTALTNFDGPPHNKRRRGK